MPELLASDWKKCSTSCKGARQEDWKLETISMQVQVGTSGRETNLCVVCAHSFRREDKVVAQMRSP